MFARRKYELVALCLGLAFSALHWFTSAPIAGLSTTSDGGVVHRFVQSIEGRISDLFFRVRGPRPANPNVVVIELDERGAQRWGLWPWPRTVLATTLEHLLDADVKVVGLDVSFTDQTPVDGTARAVVEALGAEADLSPALVTLKGGLERQLLDRPDDRLAAALKRAGPRVVQGVIPFNEREVVQLSEATLARYAAALSPQLITQVPGSVKGSYREVPKNLEAFSVSGVQTPIDAFATLGNAWGHFGTITDVDGTIRRAATLAKIGQPFGLLPSLATRVAATFLDADLVPVIDGTELNAVELRSPGGKVTRVPFQDEVSMTLIDYPGPLSTFSRVSVVDVFDGTFDRALVAGKAVLIGVTITGSSGDQRVTPFEEFASGLVTHAALASNILDGRFLDRPAPTRPVEMALMLALGLGLAMLLPRVQFRWKVLAVAGVLVGWTVLAQLAFGAGVRVAWVVPMAHLATTSFALIFLGYLSVDREKLKLRSTFSRYLGEDVIEVALGDPEKLNRGEKREMTVLFSDIRGFTSLSEHMSPEALASFINEYLSPMTRIVFDQKGTLDKYIGDALMAFWNAPLDQPDHALRACRAAVEMLEQLDQLKVGWRSAGYPELEIGIGVNTGAMVVGNMGSDVRVDYTVLGDAVNLGSRLEGTNKQYDTRIVIGEATFDVVKDQVVARRLGSVRVVGRREPVRIYELRGIGQPSAADAPVIAAFDAAIDAWSARRFKDAKAGFERVLTAWPNDPPARKYLAALDAFAAIPPGPEWDGVMRMDTK